MDFSPFRKMVFRSLVILITVKAMSFFLTVYYLLGAFFFCEYDFGYIGNKRTDIFHSVNIIG